MKKKLIVLLLVGLLSVFFLLGTVQAQGGDDGYPIETPTETDTVEPTEKQTEKPTQKPTKEPTEAPTQEPILITTTAPTQESTLLPTEPPSISESVCNGSRIHPGLDGLASRFDVFYKDLVGLYCELEASVGDIHLALETVRRSDDDTSLMTLLTYRTVEAMSWHEIWQDLGLDGNGSPQPDEGLKSLVRNMERERYQAQILNQFQNQEQNTENPGPSGEGGNGGNGEGNGGGNGNNGGAGGPGN